MFTTPRKITLSLLACAAVAAPLVASSTPAAAAVEKTRPTREKTLKVCTTGDYKPLTYRDPSSGKYSGIDVSMARNFAHYLKEKPEFVPTSWPTLMNDIATPGKCDIAVGGISITPQRQQQADFTQPYLMDGKTPITTTANAARFQTIQQIDNKNVRVIVNPGGTNADFVKQYLPNATVITWPDNNTIFDQILQGHADVMITDAIEAKYEAAQHPGLVAVHPDKPFTTAEKAYMLPKGSKLTGKADTWLARALQNGTFQRAYDRWISTPSA
ncbi:transporter substrate-binding domain-containing protein [Kitasatospora mediocidica]|uniref:transporter substrate-binding domain-containing protein n=1 Tax=Kitasatospora mediocidica TaxID=58352 RepID=UPI00056C9697|nr:transporter substrate-binding domain-containing protein [Kitasatospora mediocidica]